MKHIYEWIAYFPTNTATNDDNFYINTIVNLNTGVKYMFCFQAERDYDWKIDGFREAGYGWGWGLGYGGLTVCLKEDGKPDVCTKEELKRICDNWAELNGGESYKYIFHLKDEEYVVEKIKPVEPPKPVVEELKKEEKPKEEDHTTNNKGKIRELKLQRSLGDRIIDFFYKE